MKEVWRLVIPCIIGLWILSYGGHPQAADSMSRQTRTVVDMSGRTVEIPRTVNRIVVACYGGATNEIAVLGYADRIVAQPSVRRFPQILRMYPRFKSVPDAGSFDGISVEQVMVLKPDVVVNSVYSKRGRERIESVGIPVVAVTTGLADMGGLYKEFEMMGTILGAEERARALTQYWKDRLTLIRERTAPIGKGKKKKVFYSSSGTFLRTEGKMWWGHHFITASGGINVAANAGYKGEVTMEQLMVWDPDVVLINKDNRQVESVKKSLGKASIHQCPVGGFWWDRPSPEAILGIMWLAKTLYPDLMQDLDLKRETVTFYRTFYKHTLTDSEYAAFFGKSH